jgi:hypothetical protein
MQEEGRAGIVQYHLPKPDLDAWLEHTAPDKAWFVAILDLGASAGAVNASGACEASLSERRCKRLAAAVWFTDFTGKTAFAHFVIFRGCEHLARPICHLACRWAFAAGGLACLLGVIPAINRAAIATMRASGWQEIFRIPQACFVHRLGRHVDGVLCYFTPNLLREVMQ